MNRGARLRVRRCSPGRKGTGGGIADDPAISIDARLVGEALAGSQSACRELVQRYERPVYSLLVRLVGDPALAEDLAQETFVKAFQHLVTFDRQRRFSSWILRIAHNTGIDARRRRKIETVSLDNEMPGGAGEVALPGRPGAGSPDEALERAALGRALDTALSRIRPEYRAAIVLRYQEGFSYEELAAILGVRVGTAKTHVHRARKELAAALASLGWDEA